MIRQYRATVFLKFGIDDTKMQATGLDIDMPPSGFLYDDLIRILNGEHGVTIVEAAVVKDCAPLSNPIQEQEVKQSICEGCNRLKETTLSVNGNLCELCTGSVIPLHKKEYFGPNIIKP